MGSISRLQRTFLVSGQASSSFTAQSSSWAIGARLGPGLEYLIANQVPLRLGVVWDSYLTSAYVTAGVGYQSKSFAIDLGYRGKVSNGLENYILLGLRVFVN